MSLMTDILRETVGRIEFKTTLGPNIVLDDPFASGEPTPSTAGSVLKPQVKMYTRDGSEIASVSPYGDPGITKWPVVITSLGLLIGWLSWRAFGRK